MPSTPSSGGPIIIDSFSARLPIHPWGNCKIYSTSYSWWILRVSKVWSSHEDHVNTISKHVCGTPFITKNIWSTMLNSLYQLSKHRCMGNAMKFFSPYLKWFSTYYPVMDIICLSLGRIYPRNMWLNISSFPLFCLIWWSYFPSIGLFKPFLWSIGFKQ